MTSAAPDPAAPDLPDVPESDTVARLRDPSRLATLADGVFAIVLTILVLALSVPPKLSEASLQHVIDDLMPTVGALVISFLIVGMYWSAHRDLFARVRYASRDLVWVNLLFLLPVSLIPFGAQVIGEYPDEPLALHLYGVIVLAASLMRVVLYVFVVRRPPLLWDQTPDREVRLGFVISAVPIIPYTLAMLVAGWSTTLGRILFFAGPLSYFVVVTVLRRRPSTRAEADEFD